MKPNEKEKEIKKGKKVEGLVDKGLELVAKPVKEVMLGIEKRLNSPVDEVVNAVGELTTAQQLLNIAKKYGRQAGFNAFKKVENIGIAALSLLPVLGTASTDMVEVALMEGATVSQAEALAKGAQVVGAGEVAYPLTHIIGEKAAAKVGFVLKALDPFPDVHPLVAETCAVTGIFIPGVGAVPAGIEIGALIIKDIKNTGEAIGAVGSIIAKSPEMQSVKNFTKSVINTVSNTIQQAGSPQMTQARLAFGVA